MHKMFGDLQNVEMLFFSHLSSVFLLLVVLSKLLHLMLKYFLFLMFCQFIPLLLL